MDSCTSMFFESQIDEILEDIELIRLCKEVEEADLFTRCFLENFVDSQHLAIENHSNQPQLQAGGSLRSLKVGTTQNIKNVKKWKKIASTSFRTTGEFCTGAASTSGIALEGSHNAIASYLDNILIKPHSGINSDDVFCSACQKEVRRRYYTNHSKKQRPQKQYS